MTGLYSETQDDSSADLPQDTESESLPSTVTVTTNYEPQSVTVSTTLTNPAVTTTSITSTVAPDTVIKCHSRQPSSTVEREKTHHGDDLVDEELLTDCGILSCRPVRMQKAARIKVRTETLDLPAKLKHFCFRFADICLTLVDACNTPASPQLRLYQFRYHDHREALRHSVEPVRPYSIELRDRQRHYRDFRELFGQPPAHPGLDRHR